jgi:hypothetical protein
MHITPSQNSFRDGMFNHILFSHVVALEGRILWVVQVLGAGGHWYIL